MKIVMALAGLEIGGAETHVVELSKEIKRRGWEVIMISGGGVYQKEVEEAGIKHYVVPVSTRNYKNILIAKSKIRKILEAEKPDIVHAHARIPGFILGLLHREMKKPFVYVTTAHWTFDTSFLVKTLTSWGEKTLAVSEDIKKYLLKYYDVKEENIFISINGIDGNKFNKNVSGERVIKEFDLNPKAKRIVYVSRLNPLVCAPAFKIIENIEKIDKEIPGVEVVIVGDGDAYSDMKKKADEANEKLKRRAIILSGGRTDINEIHGTADVCVGVSRAILEPMAMEKRCVVAGQEGYIGILDENKLAEAIDCNFTCRGCAPLDGEILADDIIKLFKMNDEEAKKVTDYGKYVVDNYYSIKTMADDNMKMYDAAFRDCGKNVVMLGYYGYGNRGDDALLCAMLSDLKESSPLFSPVVLSKNPEDTSREYGVSSINRFNVFKVIKAMKHAKMFIAGGGSLIQDVTSTKSLMYYLYCIKLAKKLGLKVMLYANGIGPVKKEANKKKVAKILNLADVITLRDSDSLEFLKELGITKPEIKLTGDPVFSLTDCDSEGSEKILKGFGIEDKFIAFSARNLTEDVDGFAKSFAKMADYIAEKSGLVPVFVPMQYSKDKKISEEIIKNMKTKAVFVDKDLSVSEIMGIVSKSDFAVALRLHMLIFGVVTGVPVFGINYDLKVKSFLDLADLGFCLEPDEISNGDFQKTVDEFLDNKENIKDKILKTAEVLKDKAKENATAAAKLMEE